MKKQLFTLIAFAAGASAAYAQCGTTATRTWDGGGADENFFTAANWSGDVVPDCNDNIAFGNASNKNCEIPDSFITTGNISVNADYKGRIVVSGTGTVIAANSFRMDGTVMTFMPEIGHCTFTNLSVGDNGLFNYASRAGLTVTAGLTLNAGGFISFRTGSTINLSGISLNAYGQMKCPEKGVVNMTGNFAKAKISTFDHRFSTWNINGSAAQSIVASNGGSGLNATDGTINFWNVNLNKTNTSSTSSDNWSLNDGTDTVIVENRLTVIAGDISSSSSLSGFMFHDTLELVGQGAQGHTGRIFCGGNKTADVILNGNTNYNAASGNFIVLKANSGSVLNFRKGSASEVTLPFNIMNAIRGTIAFPDDVTVNVPHTTFTIGADATLTMPAAATVKMDAAFMNIRGTVIANQSTLEFVGSNAIETDLGGNARKAFYNITVNTTSGSPVRVGLTDTLEALNDMVLRTGIITRVAAGDAGVAYVNGDFEVLATGPSTDGLEYVLGGNSNTQYVGNALLSSGRVLIDKASASNVVSAVTTGNTVFIGSAGAGASVEIRKGVLSFEDKNGDLATPSGASPAFLIGANGRMEAPATDTLNIRGGWNFAHRNAINPRGGTITIGSASNTYNQNGNGVILNNLHVNNGGTKTWGTSDTVIVKGNLNLVASATLSSANLVFEGNLTRTSGTISLSSIIAAGGNTQTINTNSQDQLRDEGLIVNKTGGKVFIGSTIRLNSLRMSNGLLNTNGQSFILLGANSIFGGNSNSFIEGTVRIESTTAWAGSRYFVPVGRGSNYRPVQLHTSGTTNTWTVTYVASDTVTDLGTPGTHGIDAFSTSEHWIINRIAGGGGTNAAFVELSTLGKDPSWADADIRVARWNPFTTAWVNHSPSSSGASGNMIITTLQWTIDDTRVFTIGVDSVPAPDAVRNEGISGNELDLVKNTANGNSQAVATSAISFNVFPNPVAETLNIALSGADKGSITLSDLSGKVLGVYSADTRSINMRNFAAGVYFATFSNGSQRITQRVIRN